MSGIVFKTFALCLLFGVSISTSEDSDDKMRHLHKKVTVHHSVTLGDKTFNKKVHVGPHGIHIDKHVSDASHHHDHHDDHHDNLQDDHVFQGDEFHHRHHEPLMDIDTRHGHQTPISTVESHTHHKTMFNGGNNHQSFGFKRMAEDNFESEQENLGKGKKGSEATTS